MKRWLVALLLLPTWALGQNLSDRQWNDLKKFLHPDQNTQIMFSNAGTFGSDADLTWDPTINKFTANGVSIWKVVEPDTTTKLFQVLGTLPAVPTGTLNRAIAEIINSNGSDIYPQVARHTSLLAGYTGAAYTATAEFQNFAQGTNTNWMGSGNHAVIALSRGLTTGSNSGYFAFAEGGNINIGAVGNANQPKPSAVNVGGVFLGRNTSGTEIGVYGGLESSPPTFTSRSAAAVFDSGSTSSPIARFSKSGTDIATVGPKAGGDLSFPMSTHFLRTLGTCENVNASFCDPVRFEINYPASANNLYSYGAYISVDATPTTSTGSFVTGLLVDATGPSNNKGILVNTAGSTLSANSFGIYSDNSNVGTAALWDGGNYGIYSTADGVTAGQNTGIRGDASNSSLRSTGLQGIASATGTAVANGVAGYAQTSGTGAIVGGFFELAHQGSGFTSVESAALVADNSVTTHPIARFRNNGVDQVKIGDGVPADNSQHFLEVVGTLPSSPSAVTYGVVVDVTSAGAVFAGQAAVSCQLKAGYTGSASTSCISTANTAAGTSTNLFGLGNLGISGNSSATTTGSNIGVDSSAEGGNISVGSLGKAITAKNSATNIGGAFFGRNTGTTPVEIGVYAGLNTSNPTFESAALITDNAAAAQPIFLARDNGTKVYTLEDTGANWAKVGTKTLVDATATAFVRIAVPSNGRQGGEIEYCVDADDGTDFQERCGRVPFAFINKAGAETCTPLGALADVTTSPVGTLTLAFDGVNTVADSCDIRANADTSLTSTTLRINYFVLLRGNAATAVTPL